MMGKACKIRIDQPSRNGWTEGISSFVSRDSKIATVNGLLGGVTTFVREKMKANRVYEEFLHVAQEYDRGFEAGEKCVYGL